MSTRTLTTEHLDLTYSPSTYIKGDYTSGVILSVANTAGFKANNYIVLGRIGQAESAEIVKISSIDSATQMTLVAAPTFPHASDSSVTYIAYNEWRVYRSVTGIGGEYTLFSQLPIQIDQLLNATFDDTSESPYSYRYSFYNTTDTTESDLSDEYPFGGYSDAALGGIQDAVMTLFGDEDQRFLTRSMITVWANQWYRRCQLAILSSDTPYFISNFTLTAQANVLSYDISAYDVIGIYMAEISRDGGVTFVETISPKDFRVQDDAGNISTFDYRLEGNNLVITPDMPAGFIMRIWYVTNPISLVNTTDELANPLKGLVDYCVEFCLMRAHEKDRRMTELASYYQKQVNIFFNAPDSPLKKLRSRIKQGNYSISTTFEDLFDSNW
jgi:hypothetical protein